MKVFQLGSVAVAAAAVVNAISPIEIKGTRLFETETGKPFQVKGVDYYPRPNAGKDDVNNHDFFTDDYEATWRPHIKEFIALGVNTIRLYAVDPSQSHDKFMCAMSAAGIYVVVDLAASCDGCAVGKELYPTCYPPALKTRGQQIIAAFSKYNNVLAFSAGNEVNHVVKDMKTNAPCQKKFLRDMRAYIDSCATKMRYIPVGVVLADSDREANAIYYGCRSDPLDTLENAEWYGLNAYLQCDNGATTAVGPGYNKLLNDFKSYKLSIPSIMTEYGCLNKIFPAVGAYAAQRTWMDAGWLLSSTFVDVFAGGLAFEFSTENANSKADAPFPFTSYGGQNYGLGYFDPATCDGTAAAPCTYKRMPNFDNLATQYKASSTAALPLKAAYTPTVTTNPTCPTGIPTLKSITWPSDATTDMLCPDLTQTTLCPGDSIVVGKEGTTAVPTPAPTNATNTTTTAAPPLVGGTITSSPVATTTAPAKSAANGIIEVSTAVVVASLGAMLV
ncbi:Aste57867_346 [Aphanomyces stellatus]|uniref:Aste57867_346 protein n=1 Tax=Aphanomyces stellatus TaxID=120398 RepID=A0A485K6I8_9STRA|nr:hypothetical protein As57867_000346 [Aphanomyces stellatus]VFT77572.1 Aste57867_346 [Aphanomyces stellatus]